MTLDSGLWVPPSAAPTEPRKSPWLAGEGGLGSSLGQVDYVLFPPAFQPAWSLSEPDQPDLP